MEPCTFSAQARKVKKVLHEKIPYASGNGSPEKTSYIFSKESFSDISGNGNPKKFVIFQETKLSYISGSNFSSLKSKNNPFLKSFFTQAQKTSYISGRN